MAGRGRGRTTAGPYSGSGLLSSLAASSLSFVYVFFRVLSEETESFPHTTSKTDVLLTHTTYQSLSIVVPIQENGFLPGTCCGFFRAVSVPLLSYSNWFGAMYSTLVVGRAADRTRLRHEHIPVLSRHR